GNPDLRSRRICARPKPTGARVSAVPAIQQVSRRSESGRPGYGGIVGAPAGRITIGAPAPGRTTGAGKLRPRAARIAMRTGGATADTTGSAAIAPNIPANSAWRNA